jgi:hypothetical protein
MKFIPLAVALVHWIVGCPSIEATADVVGPSQSFATRDEGMGVTEPNVDCMQDADNNKSRSSKSEGCVQVSATEQPTSSVYTEARYTHPKWMPPLDPTRFARRPTVANNRTSGFESPFQISMEFLNVPTKDREYFVIAANRWQSVIVGSFDEERRPPDERELFKKTTNCTHPESVRGAFMCVQYRTRDGLGKVLGWASYLVGRKGSRTTVSGFVYIDRADVASMKKTGQFVEVITHEMGHVLGKRKTFLRFDI